MPGPMFLSLQSLLGFSARAAAYIPLRTEARVQGVS
jgi:hypothetical protein